jgi:hypothetical protein
MAIIIAQQSAQSRSIAVNVSLEHEYLDRLFSKRVHRSTSEIGRAGDPPFGAVGQTHPITAGTAVEGFVRQILTEAERGVRCLMVSSVVRCNYYF